jgi:hypothetical protein
MSGAELPAERLIVVASLRWSSPPPVGLVSRVREFLSAIYQDLLEPDEVEDVAMTAHELLENVLKYSSDGASSFEAELYDRGGQTYARLQTTNNGNVEQLAELQRLVERIGAAADPIALYDELIATSSQRNGSGLGLARVRAEAGMSIACAVDDRQICLVAERSLSIRRVA